jgi:hypothetical protein
MYKLNFLFHFLTFLIYPIHFVIKKMYLYVYRKYVIKMFFFKLHYSHIHKNQRHIANIIIFIQD